MDRTVCTERRCLYSTAIPLLHLWAVRPLQSLGACTVQLYFYSLNGPTACTEPQCLYSTAIPLLPLLAIRPVQTLSACTVELYLYFPYWLYGLYRASLSVQGYTLRFLPLFRLSFQFSFPQSCLIIMLGNIHFIISSVLIVVLVTSLWYWRNATVSQMKVFQKVVL